MVSPMEIQIIKTPIAFLKVDKHLKKEEENLSDLLSKFFVSELKVCFANSLPKRLISILSI